MENAVCAKFAHTAEDGKTYRKTFRVEQDKKYVSDFDKEVKNLLKNDN